MKHRLACTATPAPNDNEELTSQAEFLGIMPRVEMLAAYFVHDDEGWRIKGHARAADVPVDGDVGGSAAPAVRHRRR